MDKPIEGDKTTSSMKPDEIEEIQRTGKPGSLELAEPGKEQVSQNTTDETSRLQELQAHVRDQDDLERDISRQVPRLMILP